MKINRNDWRHLFIETYRRTDKKYYKIKKIAEDHISSFLTDRQALLSAAVIAVTEALKMHPNKHQIICNTDSVINMSDDPATTTSEDQRNPYEYCSNRSF